MRVAPRRPTLRHDRPPHPLENPSGNRMSQVRAINHRHVMIPSLPRACVLMPFRVGVPRLLCSWTAAALLIAGCTSGRVTGPGAAGEGVGGVARRSEEHTAELQSQIHLVCRLLLAKNME